MDFRVGLGHDSHAFCEGKKCMLGGVLFPGEKGFKANSDGDVVLHAVCNALSSAVGGRSLSSYADEMCGRGITDSREYAKVALGKVTDAGYSVSSVSVSIECAKPRIEPAFEKMQASLSKILGIPAGRIGITATTGETLSAFGKGEGVMAYAVVLVTKN
ncbi:2-C-methyl-D-erythritol 2,4-cyclodiphosphate synthase [Candidatus Micrarchaeota archaeon CG08_land_8_20_14_0_20_59_11]|nr:MAG: 2-C-methyl-D-erythritol 2,4-cyclodiphosphate synthase [Candidatus Micrarchaeota archaeon CG08_land_8_20_14_0_20_59_11]